MAARTQRPDLRTFVDDDDYAELSNLTGQRIAGFTVWEDRLVDEIPKDEPATNADGEADFATMDVDLYLEGGIYFELYSTLCYPDMESNPLTTIETLRQRLSDLTNNGLWLDDVAVDEDDQLVLILSQQHQPQLYFLVGGWLLAEWDELPE